MIDFRAQEAITNRKFDLNFPTKRIPHQAVDPHRLVNHHKEEIIAILAVHIPQTQVLPLIEGVSLRILQYFGLQGQELALLESIEGQEGLFLGEVYTKPRKNKGVHFLVECEVHTLLLS